MGQVFDMLFYVDPKKKKTLYKKNGNLYFFLLSNFYPLLSFSGNGRKIADSQNFLHLHSVIVIFNSFGFEGILQFIPLVTLLNKKLFSIEVLQDFWLDFFDEINLISSKN